MTKIGEKESKRKKKKRKKKISGSDIVLMIVFIVALSVAIFAGYRLYSIFAEYKAGVDEYSQIADTVVKERDADAEKVQKLKDAKGKIVKHWTAPMTIICITHIKKKKYLQGPFLWIAKTQKIFQTRIQLYMVTI